MKAARMLRKAASEAAVKSAVKSTNSACILMFYQPKQPKALKNFKK